MQHSISVSKEANEDLGLEIDSTTDESVLIVTGIRSHAAIWRHNQSESVAKIEVGDVIVELNDIAGDAQEMISEAHIANVWDIVFEKRGSAESVPQSSASVPLDEPQQVEPCAEVEETQECEEMRVEVVVQQDRREICGPQLPKKRQAPDPLEMIKELTEPPKDFDLDVQRPERRQEKRLKTTAEMLSEAINSHRRPKTEESKTWTKWKDHGAVPQEQSRDSRVEQYRRITDMAKFLSTSESKKKTMEFDPNGWLVKLGLVRVGESGFVTQPSDRGLTILGFSEGVINKYNELNTKRQVMVGDCIIAVNGTESISKMTEALSKEGHLEILVCRPDLMEDESDEEMVLPLWNVIQRLREIQQPIRFFAESDRDIYNRWKRLQFEGATLHLDLAQGSHTIAHQEKEMEKKGEEIFNEDLTHLWGPSKDIYEWIRYVMDTWESDLKEKKLPSGHQQMVTFKSSQMYLKPFLKLLRRDQVPKDVTTNIHKILTNCRTRNYEEAHQVYMDLAIGNKPWPIGVTMSTFHERAAHARIGSDNEGHVLQDETTRKYIHAVKRLLTFSQQKWPST